MGACLLQMPDAAAAPEEPDDSDFELDVDDDDDVPLAKKKQKSVRCDICFSASSYAWSVKSHYHVQPVSCLAMSMLVCVSILVDISTAQLQPD